MTYLPRADHKTYEEGFSDAKRQYEAEIASLKEEIEKLKKKASKPKKTTKK
jgi:uncharacterized protein (DUF2164 family)